MLIYEYSILLNMEPVLVQNWTKVCREDRESRQPQLSARSVTSKTHLKAPGPRVSEVIYYNFRKVISAKLLYKKNGVPKTLRWARQD